MLSRYSELRSFDICQKFTRFIVIRGAAWTKTGRPSIVLSNSFGELYMSRALILFGIFLGILVQTPADRVAASGQDVQFFSSLMPVNSDDSQRSPTYPDNRSWSPTRYPLEHYPTEMDTADLDEDGIEDIILVYPGWNDIDEQDVIHLYLSGTNPLGSKPLIVHCRSHFTEIGGIGDIDGDGHLDIVLIFGYHRSRYTFEVVPMRADGKVGIPYPLLRKNEFLYYGPSSVYDMDGDGIDEIVLCYKDHSKRTQIQILNIRHKSVYRMNSRRVRSKYYNQLFADDVNGDGIGDLLLLPSSSAQGQHLELWTGRGDHQFKGPRFLQVGRMPYEIALSDINADGAKDIVAPGWFRLGNGDGHFRKVKYYMDHELFHAYLEGIGDIDRDGFPDLLARPHYRSDSALLLYRGGRDGFRSAPAVILPWVYERSDVHRIVSIDADPQPEILTFTIVGIERVTYNLIVLRPAPEPPRLQIENLAIGGIRWNGNTFHLSGTIDYRGENISMINESANGDPSDGAFMCMHIEIENPEEKYDNDYYTYLNVAGSFMHHPGQDQGTIEFNFNARAYQPYLRTQGFNLSLHSIQLFDKNMVLSNVFYADREFINP